MTVAADQCRYAHRGLYDSELEADVCYFNAIAFPIGQYVRSGSEILHCVERGVWVRQGEIEV